MSNADKIRMYGTQAYVVPARRQKQKRFSIRAGDVVRELRLTGRAPAVCSALKSREFLQRNMLRLVDRAGPGSGQSTTVVYTYEFVSEDSSFDKTDSWARLRGVLKDVFAEMGGGEQYLQTERSNFYPFEESK